MVFVVVEDGTVEVLDESAQAQTYESIDVESGVFVFYDEDGTWLRPRFTRSNRRLLFGILEQGSFVLERSSQLDPAVDPFFIALGETVFLKPNKHFPSLEAIRRHVESIRSRDSNGMG